MPLPVIYKRRYWKKILRTAPANLIAYWPLNEPSGTTLKDFTRNGYNGTATGFDRLQAGIGDGNTCPYLDGVNDKGNIYSVGFAGAFNGAEGSFSIWAKVDTTGIWADGLVRYIVDLSVDGNNIVRINRQATNNGMALTQVAGGVSRSVAATVGPTLAWVHYALTWSKAADQLKAYINGVQSGSTQTGLGVWAGSLGANASVLGAVNIAPGGQVWSGYLAHAAVWTTPLSAAQVSALSKVS